MQTKTEKALFPAILSVFNHYGRMPEPSEIYFCNKETTLEEIEIFLYRFFLAAKQRCESQILVLASFHLLPYTRQTEVADALEEMISKFGTDKAATLVLLSGERNTWLGHRFARCKTKFPIISKSQLQEYVKSYFGSKDTDSKARGSVLCVTGDSDGSGKSHRILQKVAALMERDAKIVYQKVPFCRGFPLIPLLMKSEGKHQVPKALHFDFSRVLDSEAPFVVFSLFFLGFTKDSSGCIVYPRKMVDICYLEVPSVILEGNSTLKGLFELIPTERVRYCREQFSLTVPKHEPLTGRLRIESRADIQTVARILRALRSGCVDIKSLTTDVASIRADEAYDLIADCAHSEIHSYAESSNLVKFLERGFRGIDAGTGYFLFAYDHTWVQEHGFSLPEFRAAFCKLVIQTSRIFAMRSIPRGSQHLAERVECMRRWRDLEANPIAIWYSALDSKGDRTPDSLDILCRPKDPNITPIEVIGRYLSKHTLNWLAEQKLELNKSWHTMQMSEFYDYLRRVDGWSQKRRESANDENLSNYCMTFDNFMKMIQITLRLNWKVPIVIMGETGCGKSALVTNLLKVLRISLEVNHWLTTSTSDIINLAPTGFERARRTQCRRHSPLG